MLHCCVQEQYLHGLTLHPSCSNVRFVADIKYQKFYLVCCEHNVICNQGCSLNKMRSWPQETLDAVFDGVGLGLDTYGISVGLGVKGLVSEYYHNHQLSWCKLDF